MFPGKDFFRIPEEVFVAQVELASRLYLRLPVPVQRSHHPDQCRPVTGTDQLPVGLFAGILILDPGFLPHFLGPQQRIQRFPGQKGPQFGKAAALWVGTKNFAPA